MKNEIIIQDWVGNILFQGLYTDKEVDDVLDANRCYCHSSVEEIEDCAKCDNTGYIGDFEVYWTDESRKDNVYDFINY